MTANSILLRRGRILVGEGDTPADGALAATFNQNLQALGYVLTPDALAAVAALPRHRAASLYQEVVGHLREMRGVRRFRPMYPNFPAQVVDAGDAELYLNAITHYFSAWVADITGDEDVIWLPKYRKRRRSPLEDRVALKVLRLGSGADLAEIARRIATSNTSISPTDREELAWLVEHGHLPLPERIPNKENLALVGSLLLASAVGPDRALEDATVESLTPLFATATDVLRLAVAMSEGDVSLATPTRFRGFTRPERRALLVLLEACGAGRLEDMQRWGERWRRLGERLHPGELAGRFPESARAFQRLRADERVRSFNSRVERAVRSGRVADAVELLGQRPGEFARRLDQLLRLAGGRSDLVLESFSATAARVSTPVLLQVASHFRGRSSPGQLRVVFPKGRTARVRALENDLTPLLREVCDWVGSICAETLERRFSRLPPLGRVYVDPDLRHYMVPFSQRSASRSLRTLERGSRIRFGRDADTLRFFIWWKQQPHIRTDLDLSAILYGPDWQYVEHVAYFRLRSEIAKGTYRAYHSGDITEAPDGACEFIDVDMPSMTAYGARYVVMTVTSFTRQRFSTLAECSAGWMLRQFPDSGEVFDPRTVEDRIDVTSDSTLVMPLVVDLVQRRVIWADVAIRASRRRLNNIAGNYDSITLIGRALSEVEKPTLFDLLRLHARARGTPVSSEEEADTVFSVALGTPFDVNRIASELMANQSPEAAATGPSST